MSPGTEGGSRWRQPSAARGCLGLWHGPRSRHGPRRHRAFTLTELLVVVSIVAILAMVALPSYQGQILKTRRTDAKQGLMRVSSQMERCYSRYRRFDSPECPLVTSGPTISTSSPDGYYSISSQIPSGSETLEPETFTLFAVPQGPQAADTQCARFQITQGLARAAQDLDGADTTDLCW